MTLFGEFRLGQCEIFFWIFKNGFIAFSWLRGFQNTFTFFCRTIFMDLATDFRVHVCVARASFFKIGRAHLGLKTILGFFIFFYLEIYWWGLLIPEVWLKSEIQPCKKGFYLPDLSWNYPILKLSEINMIGNLRKFLIFWNSDHKFLIIFFFFFFPFSPLFFL